MVEEATEEIMAEYNSLWWWAVGAIVCLGGLGYHFFRKYRRAKELIHRYELANQSDIMTSVANSFGESF